MTKGLPRSLSRASLPRSPIQSQTIVLRGKAISVSSITTGPGTGTVVAEGFPEGNLLFLGAVANLSFAGSGSDANLVDTWAGDFGIGTAPLTGVTLDTDEVDLVVSTALAAATAEVSPVTRGTSLAADAGEIHDNTASTLEINVNLLIDAADIGDGQTVAMTIDGEIYLSYIILGDD